MGADTAIAWTDHTFNPWWGCARVSPGCLNCYAETFAKRTGHDVWGKGGERRFFADKHWHEPIRWSAAAEAFGVRRRVFCASMADVFEDRADLEVHRARLFGLIAETVHLDWQLLTKRPENIPSMVPAGWLGDWPDNVWVGTTVEDQVRAEERVPRLLEIPAPVRFLSCEPLLAPVDISRWLEPELDPSACGDPDHCSPYKRTATVDWVIVGGESGPRHRVMDLDWARSLRDQCAEAYVPFFFKQVGGRTAKAGGNLLDDETCQQFPMIGVT